MEVDVIQTIKTLFKSNRKKNTYCHCFVGACRFSVIKGKD